jgi:beta-mannosidase
MQDSAAVGAVTGQQLSGGSYTPSGWYNAVVPGTVLQTLADSNHLYPNPDSGLTLAGNGSVPDIAGLQKKYWYYASFAINASDTAGHQAWLCFDGINYMADIYLNGKLLPDTLATMAPGTGTKSAHTMIGAFRRGVFNVTGLARAGTNYLAVKIYPPLDPGVYHTKQNGPCGVNGGLMTEDGPTFIASQGWEWMPTVPDRDMGIWNGVYMKLTGPVVVRQPFARCSLPAPYTAASCTLSVQLRNSAKVAVTGTIHAIIDTVNSITFDSMVTVAPLDTPTITFNAGKKPALEITGPRLWWPNNMGAANLYKVGITFTPTGSVLSDSTLFYFGIRTITAVRGNTALGLQVSINGKRVTLRGGTWGMDDFMKRTDYHKLEAKIKYHTLQNFNTVRNFIGGIDDERFYEYCDKYGLLVWDDFWSPGTAEGPANLAAAIDTTLWLANATEKILRYRNHPAVFLWCARSESTPVTALYAGLQYRATVLDGTRIIQQSSGSNDVVAAGPYGWLPPDSAIAHVGGFNTEIGGPAFPSLESINKFMPVTGQLPITTATANNQYWSFHDFCSGADTAVNYIAGMTGRFGAATTMADFCRKSQLLNYDQYRAFFEALNSRKWKSAVAEYLWLSNPAWPSTAGQTYDYYLEGTGGMYGAMHACEPVHVQYYFIPGSSTVKGYSICNNNPVALANYKVKARVYALSGALAIADSQTFVSVPADTTVSGNALPVLPTTLSAAYFLEMRLTDASGNLVSKNVYWLPKTGQDMSSIMSMGKATLTMTSLWVTRIQTAAGTDTLKVTLKNNSAPVAMAARLKVVRATSGERVLPAYYSDNYFSIVPADSQSISIAYDRIDLNGELPKLVLSGINIDSVVLPIGSNVTGVRSRNNGAARAGTGMSIGVVGSRLRLNNVPQESGWKIEVFDMQGRIVVQSSGESREAPSVSLKSLHPGAYVAVAESAGERVRTLFALNNGPASCR